MRLALPKHFDLLANFVCDIFLSNSFVLCFVYFRAFSLLNIWLVERFETFCSLTISLSVRYGHVVPNIRKQFVFWIEKCNLRVNLQRKFFTAIALDPKTKKKTNIFRTQNIL